MKLFAFLFLFLFSTVHAQSEKEILENEICAYITTEKLSESYAINYVMTRLMDYYHTYPKEFSEKEYILWGIRIIENCDFARETHTKNFNEKYNSDLYNLKTEPKSILKNSRCTKILKNLTAYYRDLDGKITEVKIFDNNYFETFQDGTFSQLKFENLKNCNYRLHFIKTNNNMKKFANEIIDIRKTKYSVLEENEKYYTVSVSGINPNIYSVYRFYKKIEDVPKVNH